MKKGNNIISNPKDKIANDIKAKGSYLIKQFFEESQIQSLFSDKDSSHNPFQILEELKKLSNLLKETSTSEIDLVSNSLKYLLNEERKITFFEIENSKIIVNFCKYIDSTFSYNLSKKNPLAPFQNHSDSFYEKLLIFNNFFKNSGHDINHFLKILQYCVTSMNCFQLNLSQDLTLKPSIKPKQLPSKFLLCSLLFFNKSASSIF